MGVVVKAVEEAQQALVDHRVMTDAAGEFIELPPVRQLAVQDEIAHLHETALLGELLHGVSPVEQQPCVTIDVGDAAFAGGGYRESGIESEDLVVAVNGRDVEDSGPQSALTDRKLRRPACSAVAEFERLLGHFPCGDAGRGCDCIHVHLQHTRSDAWTQYAARRGQRNRRSVDRLFRGGKRDAQSLQTAHNGRGKLAGRCATVEIARWCGSREMGCSWGAAILKRKDPRVQAGGNFARRVATARCKGPAECSMSSSLRSFFTHPSHTGL